MRKQEEARLAPESAVAKAYYTDSRFRADFDKDPRAAIAKLMGGEIPPNIEIVVHHNNSKTLHIAVTPPEEPGETTDEQLGSISGGGYCYTSPGSCYPG